eukprot:2823401-Pyramimonas_sp.AAC.2
MSPGAAAVFHRPGRRFSNRVMVTNRRGCFGEMPPPRPRAPSRRARVKREYTRGVNQSGVSRENILGGVNQSRVSRENIPGV